MTINSTKFGPGTLKLGTGPLAIESQLLSCKVVPAENVTTRPARKVLSGEELGESSSATYTATLQGTFLQDLGIAAGIVAWSWANKGTSQTAIFVPNSSKLTTPNGVSGLVIPVPLVLGGDEMEADLEADFTWRFAAFPTLGDYVP